MSRTTNQHAVTPTSLIDEVFGLLQRGEDALFDDLAHATWSPQATLSALTGSHNASGRIAGERDVA